MLTPTVGWIVQIWHQNIVKLHKREIRQMGYQISVKSTQNGIRPVWDQGPKTY